MDVAQDFLKTEWAYLWKHYGLHDPPPYPKHKDITMEKTDASLNERMPSRSSVRIQELGEVGTIPHLEGLKEAIGECTRCPLSQGRTHLVFGEGNPQASLMFVGEGPGADEDKTGRPFVGRAGQLLTKIIQAMGFEREHVYIANIVKCRPPGNRTPLPLEAETCLPFLKAQIKLVSPKIIVCLGSCATSYLLASNQSQGQGISKLRGQLFDLAWEDDLSSKILPTFHPSYLLRNPPAKALVWEDMKKVMTYLSKASGGAEETRH